MSVWSGALPARWPTESACPLSQDPQARNPTVAGALRVPATEETPEVCGVFDSRRLAKEGRWESMGNRRVSKGGRSRSVSVVADDGQARGCGFRGGRAADGGNRTVRRDDGSPGRALTPVRAPVRKIARRFHCHRNCANDRSGLTGDVRRADVFVRPA